MGKNQYVVPKGNGWAVRSEGSSRISSQHRTQAAAIRQGRSNAIRNGSELTIQGRDGRIRDRDSFGSDPCPPKDKKH